MISSPLGYPHGMEDLLDHRDSLFKHLKRFVLQQADRLKAHVHAMAEQAGRPWDVYLTSPTRKDLRARRRRRFDTGFTLASDVCYYGTHPGCATEGSRSRSSHFAS